MLGSSSFCFAVCRDREFELVRIVVECLLREEWTGMIAGKRTRGTGNRKDRRDAKECVRV